MPTPWTPRRHLDEDLARVDALLNQAGQLNDAGLQADLARHAVAASVGAMDAYLCDAYVGLLVATVKAFRQGTLASLPPAIQKETLPIGPLLAKHYPARPNWGLRMAARSRMERDNMLQVGKVKDLFNPFLPAGHKLWLDLVDTYVAVDRQRLTRWRPADLAGLTGDPLQTRHKQAVKALMDRVGLIVQRRHDIVHNCDRPKVAVQPMPLGRAKGMRRDIGDFITILDDHLSSHRVA